MVERSLTKLKVLGSNPGWGGQMLVDESCTGRELDIVDVYAYRQKPNCSRRAPGYFTLIGGMTQPAARDSSEAVKSTSLSHIGNSGHSWRSSIGFSIRDEAVNVARSAPQGTHYHANVIHLFP